MSQGWLTQFKNCHNLNHIKKHGEAASVNPEDVGAEIICVRAITDEYNPSNVYNMDETGLFYR